MDKDQSFNSVFKKLQYVESIEPSTTKNIQCKRDSISKKVENQAQDSKAVHMLNLKNITRYPMSGKNSDQLKKEEKQKWKSVNNQEKQQIGHSNLLNKKNFAHDYYTQNQPKMETPKQ